MLLYGREVWGPISNPELKNWNNNPAKQFQLEFSKNILQIHRNTPNNACRAELGLFPLHIPIQKRAIKFWHHLNKADKNSLNYKALLSNRSSQDNVALDQMALRLIEQSNIKINESQSQIPNQSSMKNILKTVDLNLKSKYTEHWKNIKINLIAIRH